MFIKYKDTKPKIADNVYLAPGSKVIGKVTIAKNSSIWHNAVIRGDVDQIKIGIKTNIQENCSLHVDHSTPLTIANNVTVGHGAILHGCTINNNCLIGMGARILNNASIGNNCIIGAGTVITEEKEIPPGNLVLGVPGKIVRKINEKEREKIQQSAKEYYNLSQQHQNEK